MTSQTRLRTVRGRCRSEIRWRLARPQTTTDAIPDARAVIGDALDLSADPAEEGGLSYPDLPDLEQAVDYAIPTTTTDRNSCNIRKLRHV